jgi:glycosyltransferase involved in cell wall biosynthesis
MAEQLISVILPVYNEEENIAACLRGLARALEGLPHEILACYDFDGDTTIPAIERMADKPASVRPVRNTLGRGAAFAIRAGFQAARGDVLVVSMADLSDPPEVIRDMARKIREEGADVVSGSRYMKGGSQTGGPRLKTLLSRAAGLSLRRLAGLGTHDATTNFRAYSRRFVEKVDVESRHGFELALELTVKAHLKGFRVDEVPSTWQDRSAGESRFQLWTWLPRYLRWYLTALADPLIVWTVLIGSAIAAMAFALRHAPPLPLIDEWYYVGLLSGRESLSLSWLWDQHILHRIPLPKLLWFSLERLTGVDSRWGVAANVLLLAASSAVLVLALRRFRGRTSWTDAFVPLLFLHWDHGENMTWPFQAAFILHHLFVCFLIAMILDLNRTPVSKLALPFGLCLAALPLVGSSMIPLVVAIAPWWMWVAARGQPRIRPWISIGLPVLALVLGAVQTLSYQRPPDYPRSPGPLAAATVALQFLAGSLGFKGTRLWPESGGMILVALGIALVLLLKEWRRQLPARGLLSVLAGLLILALLIGHSRSAISPFAGFWERYVVLASILPLLVYVSTEFFRPALVGHVARMTLLLLLAFVYRLNVDHAVDSFLSRRQAEESLIRDVQAGVPAPILARLHLFWYVDSRQPDSCERDLRVLAEDRKAVFGRHPYPDSALRWDGEPLRLPDGRMAFSIGDQKPYSPELAAGDHPFRIDFGRFSSSTTPVRFRAVRRSRDGAAQTVWSSSLISPASQREMATVKLKDGDRLSFEVEGSRPGDRFWILLDRGLP